jgi:hypothetical protein
MKIQSAMFVTMILLASHLLASCASHAPRASHEIFDDRTARTFLVSGASLVFARARSDVAAHARDYATLVPVEIDQSGDYREYLLLYRWSMVDPRMSPPPDSGAGAMRLIADGRVIDAKPLDTLPLSLDKRRELLVPNHGDVVPRAYQFDVATLNFIATSRELTLRMPQEALDTPFGLWEDGRGALKLFLQRAAP